LVNCNEQIYFYGSLQIIGASILSGDRLCPYLNGGQCIEILILLIRLFTNFKYAGNFIVLKPLADGVFWLMRGKFKR